MSDSTSAILPITASVDGTKNMFYMRCSVIGQMMNYAACLWRQGVLTNPKTRVPADWNPCGEAAKCGRCPAVDMRREEELQGKAIYFRGRSTELTVKQQAVKFHERDYGPVSSITSVHSSEATLLPRPTYKPVPQPVVAVKRSSGSMLDVMGAATDYAAAINSAVEAKAHVTESAPAKVTPPEPPKPVIKVAVGAALPGESPLAMARRLAAQRAAAVSHL